MGENEQGLWLRGPNVDNYKGTIFEGYTNPNNINADDLYPQLQFDSKNNISGIYDPMSRSYSVFNLGKDGDNGGDKGFLGMGLAGWNNAFNIGKGLAGMYFGNKQLGLAEDAFNFNKEMKTKEYDMAKDAYDRQVARAQSISDQMNAGKVG